MAITANQATGLAPPTDDPLLQSPKIDFDKLMVSVVISHEPNCFTGLDIVGVELAPKVMEVLCHYSEPGLVVPKVVSYGAHCANCDSSIRRKGRLCIAS
jgi:hypothetical protein